MAGAAADEKDVNSKSVACERAGRLHGPYTDRPGSVTTRPGLARPSPMVFQKL